jgi:hypothetical protein
MFRWFGNLLRAWRDQRVRRSRYKAALVERRRRQFARTMRALAKRHRPLSKRDASFLASRMKDLAEDTQEPGPSAPPKRDQGPVVDLPKHQDAAGQSGDPIVHSPAPSDEPPADPVSTVRQPGAAEGVQIPETRSFEAEVPSELETAASTREPGREESPGIFETYRHARPVPPWFQQEEDVERPPDRLPRADQRIVEPETPGVQPLSSSVTDLRPRESVSQEPPEALPAGDSLRAPERQRRDVSEPQEVRIPGDARRVERGGVQAVLFPPGEAAGSSAAQEPQDMAPVVQTLEAIRQQLVAIELIMNRSVEVQTEMVTLLSQWSIISE